MKFGAMQKNDSTSAVPQRLRQAGVIPTTQRLLIARELFEDHGHFSAQQLYQRVNKTCRRVCRATVYNTLNLFVNRGLVREVAVNGNCTFYDTNLQPHYHIYNIDTGELLDVDPESVVFKTLPVLPAGTRRENIELLIRVRNQNLKLSSRDI